MSMKRRTPNRRGKAATPPPRPRRHRPPPAMPPTSGSLGGTSSLARDLYNAHFHVSILQIEVRTGSRNLGCLIERRRFNDEDAAHRVLGFDERSVNHFAATDCQPPACLIVKLERPDVP